MKQIINIVFCPQDKNDTVDAVVTAINLIDAGETVTLECDVSLISIECLSILSARGFKFASDIKRFIK